MKKIERRNFLRWLGTAAGGLCFCPHLAKGAAANPLRSPAGTNIYVLEDAFGRAEIDLKHPTMTSLYLRQSSGLLGVKQLLSEHASDFPEWAIGGTSYLVGQDGKRYESRSSTKHRWELDGRSRTLRISDIHLSNNDGKMSPCTEEWVLSVTDHGGLRWQIHRRFTRPFKAVYHGGPAFFFNISPNSRIINSPMVLAQRHNPAGNAVAVTWWVQENALNGQFLPDYWQFPTVIVGKNWFPQSNSLTMRGKNGWAIFKLYTSFPHDQDLKMHAKGGHLYRRGMFYGFQEVGVTPGPGAEYGYGGGETVTLAIELEPTPQDKSGQQLMVHIPDSRMESSLKSYFSGLANSGCLMNCNKHLLGNECDGYFYAGNMHWHAYSLLASRPAPQPLSSAPVSYLQAFRKTLINNLDSVDDRGEIMTGYRHENAFPEIPMMNLVGLEAYLLYSGDVDLAERYSSTVEQLDAYLQDWLTNGVFYAPADRIRVPNRYINWYYDIVIGAHGYTMYHNVNYVRALKALEIIYAALGSSEHAESCHERRQLLVSRINDMFWGDNTYGQGRGGYVDWIREDGVKGEYFFACNQYPAILFDIASPDQARKMIATADARIEELTQYFDYSGDGTLDNLWPLRRGDIHDDFSRFGGLCNGGMLLAMTFWELAARCHAGAADSAHKLLENFSKHAAKTNWFGGANGFSITGEPAGPFYEPFLADGLIVAAGTVHGFLGLRYSWGGFRVFPHLPSRWDEVSAQIMFKGAPYRVGACADGHVSVTKGT